MSPRVPQPVILIVLRVPRWHPLTAGDISIEVGQASIRPEAQAPTCQCASLTYAPICFLVFKFVEHPDDDEASQTYSPRAITAASRSA